MMKVARDNLSSCSGSAPDCDAVLDEAAEHFRMSAADCYGMDVRLEARIIVSPGIEIIVRAGAV